MENTENNNKYDFFELDSGTILAFPGITGSEGLLVFRGTEWNYYPVESEYWDYFHQTVYKNHRAVSLKQSDLDKIGIPVPATKNITPPSPEKSLKTGILLSEIPSHLRKKLEHYKVIYLLLKEDEYEKSMGDGRYLYPEKVFIDRASARIYLSNLKKQQRSNKGNRGENSNITPGYTYRLKKIQFRLDKKEKKLTADLDIRRYEHYSIEDIIRLLKK